MTSPGNSSIINLNLQPALLSNSVLIFLLRDSTPFQALARLFFLSRLRSLLPTASFVDRNLLYLPALSLTSNQQQRQVDV